MSDIAEACLIAAGYIAMLGFITFIVISMDHREVP